MFIASLALAAAPSAVAFPARHPLLPAIECRVDSRDTVRADLYVMKDGSETKIASFGSWDPPGYCELAIRNLRGGVACVSQNYTVTALDVATGQVRGAYGSENEQNYKRCYAAVNKDQLRTVAGYMDFIAP